MEPTPTTLEVFMHDNLRVPRHLAMYGYMNGPDDAFLWDKTCLTQIPSGGVEAAQLSMYIAMYMLPDGDTEFMYMKVDPGSSVTEAMFALAISSMTELPAWVQESAKRRDHRLAAAGGFTFDGGTTYAETVRAHVLKLLPPTDTPPLPVAYAALHSLFEPEGRTHLDFMCHKQVPVVPIWKTFQWNVATGLIGL